MRPASSFVLYLAYRLIDPFIIPIFLAVVLVVVSAPLYQFFFLRILGRRPWLASAVTCLLLTVIIALPVFLDRQRHHLPGPWTSTPR